MVDDGYDDEPGYESEDDFLDDPERREDAEDQWKCQLGKDCLVASPFHHRDECFSVEMAREMFDEPAPGLAAGDLTVSPPEPDDLSLS